MKTLEVESQTLINWLQATPVTDGLLPGAIAAIAPRVAVMTFIDEEVLGATGEAVSEFWVIVEGVVDSFYEDIHGQRNWLMAAGPGDSVGEVTLIERTPRPVHLIAQTPGVLLSISAEVFYELLETYPVLMRNLFRKLSTRLKDVVGVSRRKLASPRLVIVAGSPRSWVLVGRLVSRLLAAGETLAVYAEVAEALFNASAWPKGFPVSAILAGEHPP